MEDYFLKCIEKVPTDYISPSSLLISLFLILITYYYVIHIKKRNLFNLDKNLEREMNSFRTKQTILYFHFTRYSNDNKSYKVIYLPSQEKTYNIKGNELIIDYKDTRYPFKYNVAEEITLFDKDAQKSFIIVVNKFVENHYNVILDINENKKTFSLEIIIYSKIKKCLEEINKLQSLKNYFKENYLQNILRLNIINASVEDLCDIYSMNMEKEEKLKINEDFFSDFEENLLINLIYAKNEKLAFRRIFKNTKEKILLNFTQHEMKLLKELYNNVIKKYLKANPDDPINRKNMYNKFVEFDKNHGYSSTINEDNNKETGIKSDLRLINSKFSYYPFYILIFDKKRISREELDITEYLCYLNLILLDDKKFLDRIYSLNEQKNKIFNKYSYLTNKDKSLILINLLKNEKKNKSNYQFRSFYDLPEHSPYIQSELFFRKTISKLNDNSSLSFLFLQLNSGSGEDYLDKEEYYKIRMIPLIEIKYLLLKKFFYTYFFTYDSNNNIMALNNVSSLIISFNESADIGYSMPQKLAEFSSINNTIKLAFLKFHENAPIKFEGNFNDKIDHRYLLDDNFEIINNRYRKNSNINSLNAGESGNALDYFIFKDYLTLDKLMKSKEDLSPLNDISLLTQENFVKLREKVGKLIEDVELTNPYDKTNELSKKYEEIKKTKKFKDKKQSEIRFSDLEIDEIY